MSDMTKSFMLMVEPMKISMQQMTMIQQQQQQQQQHSMVSSYQPTHHSHPYSAQQAHQRPIFHTLNNAYQPKIMSTSPQTMPMKARPKKMNAPQQTMNSQKDATSETFFSPLRYFQ